MVIMDSLAVERQIIANYKETGDYTRMYREYAKLAEIVWASTGRKDYQADLWYNLNRNEICLEMLGNLCNDKKVIFIGGGQWMDKALLEAITAQEIIRTDIVGDKDVIEANAANLPFSAHSFDIVICRELIEHVLDEQVVYAEIKRVLKPCGYLLITTPNAYALSIDGTIHRRAYTPTSFLKELERQGFSIIKKRGNVPYILRRLLDFSQQGLTIALEDFKKIDRLTRDYKNRYYLSTQLFVLCRKRGAQ